MNQVWKSMLAACVVVGSYASVVGEESSKFHEEAFSNSFTLSNEIKDLEMRASNGDPIARYDLGVVFFNGLGVRVDLAEANVWFRKAAEQGFPLAQYQLGLSYGKGAGVAQDLTQAYLWLGLATLAGVEAAAADWRVAAALMKPAETIEGRQLIFNWRPRNY